MEYLITSTKNDKFKYFKNLKQKKFRTNEFTVEGKKSVLEALNSQYDVTAVLLSESYHKKEDINFSHDIPLYIFPDSVFSELSSTDTPSGIMCSLKTHAFAKPVLDVKNTYIYCDKISDPGNLGTIIRTADAAGFGGIMLSPQSVELYNPKIVRSSMGSFFRMPIYENITPENLMEYKSLGFNLFCGILSDNTIEYTDVDFTKPAIIVIGNESNGVSSEVSALSDYNIKIPILGGAESLNAAIAAGIIMYEVLRQRRGEK